MSALRTGSDLVTVYCANEATLPIKSYSPELMVEGVYSAKEFDELALTSASASASASELAIDTGDDGDDGDDDIENSINGRVDEMVQKVVENLGRMHSIIIGPGLGRCPLVLKATAMIIQNAMKRNLNIVLDADGLYLLSLEENKDIFVNGLSSSGSGSQSTSSSSSSSRVVITPNVVEYKRLVETMGEGSEEILKSRLPGVTVVRKGHEDVIETIPRGGQEQEQAQAQEQGDTDKNKDNIQSRMVCTEKGGLKRSGGLGDILAGSIGTFVAWNKILENQSVQEKNTCEDNLIQDELVLGCWMACCLTKKSTLRAFQKRKRSMTAPDVLEEIGDVMDEIASSTIEY